MPRRQRRVGVLGGYVIASQTAGTITVTDTGAGSELVAVQTTRLGYQRTTYLNGVKRITYVLPTTPAFTLTRAEARDASHHAIDLSVVDATGAELVHHAYATVASGSATCEQQYQQALADGRFWSSVAAIGVSGAIMVGGTAAGISVAVTGGILGIGTLGAGSVLAIAVGTGIGTASAGMATVAYEATLNTGDRWAESHALQVREACELGLAIEDFEPEALPSIDAELAATPATGSNMSDLTDAVACDNETDGTVEIDGELCEQHCEQRWVDGECKLLCVIVCD